MFSIPEFPLEAAIFDSHIVPEVGPPRLLAPCNVALGRRAMPSSLHSDDDFLGFAVQLLFPAGTDIRDAYMAEGSDQVVVPAGSGRLYKVFWVNDLGTGFPNEHRVAVCQKAGRWPAPLPPVYVPPGGVLVTVLRGVGRVRPSPTPRPNVLS